MKQPDGDNAGSGSGVVLLSGECRPLRRALRPLVWVVLEEVALDAVVEDGSLVARTSARHVAERLGVNPGTAAEALRVLGRRGLVGLEREKGPAGRFGLSVYQFRPPTGLVCRPTMYGGAIHGGTVHGGAEHGWTPGGFAVCGRIKCGIVEVRDRCTWSGQPPGRWNRLRSDVRSRQLRRHPRTRFARSSALHCPARFVSALPGADGAGSRVGVVVTAPAVASSKTWQVSVVGWAGGGDGMVVGGVMAVGMGVMAVDGDGMVGAVGGGGGC